MKRAKVNEKNWKKFSKGVLLPTEGEPIKDKFDLQVVSENLCALEKYARMYDSLSNLRNESDRCVRYYFGDQFSDYVQDPDHGGYITEKEYMINQGMTPLSLNIIRSRIKPMIKIYRDNKQEPIVLARDRDEQKVSEMIQTAVQCAYQNYNIAEENARGYEECLISGIPIFRTGFDWLENYHMHDVYVQRCDLHYMFWDNNTGGLYFENISTIGQLHDMTFGELLTRFAKSREDRKKIEDHYKKCANLYQIQDAQFRKDKKNFSFYTPLSPDKFRVIEVWEKEYFNADVFHDTAKGEEVIADNDTMLADIAAENEKRIAEMISAGGRAEDAATIDWLEYKVFTKWVVRFITPDGYLLNKRISPYAHGSHPFAIGAYPLINGEIHSTISDAINPQRMVNRLLSRIEFQRMNDDKGLYIWNKDVLERSNVTLREASEQSTSARGSLALRWKDGEVVLKQPAHTSSNGSDLSMFQMFMESVDKVTGSTGAARGEKPTSGTAASLYMQQLENSENNIGDLEEWYNGLVRIRDYKMMCNIIQFYNGRRFMDIAGKDYGNEAKWYDSKRIPEDVRFDLVLIEGKSTGLTRMQGENLLQDLFNKQVIPAELYLELSNLPYTDKALERLKSYQEEIQKKQAEQQQALQQQQMAQAEQQAMAEQAQALQSQQPQPQVQQPQQ